MFQVCMSSWVCQTADFMGLTFLPHFSLISFQKKCLEKYESQNCTFFINHESIKATTNTWEQPKTFYFVIWAE